MSMGSGGDITNAGDRDELRAAAEASLKRKHGFLIHARIYVLVNLLLWVIWAVLLITSDGAGIPWPVFPMLGWGIGLYFHWRAAYRAPPAGPSETEIDREMRRLEARSGNRDR